MDFRTTTLVCSKERDSIIILLHFPLETAAFSLPQDVTGSYKSHIWNYHRWGHFIMELGEAAFPTTSFFLSPSSLHTLFLDCTSPNTWRMLRMHLHLAEGLPSSACWEALQMVRTGAKQPQKQTVSWRSRRTQLPLSLHIPGWNPTELILGKTKQADPDPRNAQLGRERAGTANLCHVYTHHLPSGEAPQTGLSIILEDFFQAICDLPSEFCTLLLEPYDGPIEGGGPRTSFHS